MVKIHTEDKILMLLLENRAEITINALAKQIKVDYKTVHIKVRKSAEEGIIRIKKAGNTCLCSIKPVQHPSIIRAEFIRTQQILKKKNIWVLFSRIADGTKSPFFILLLFGSHASGTARKQSDIDLMLICDDTRTSETIQAIINNTPLETHLLSFTTKEFISMIKTTDFNVAKEAVKNSIILFGIDDYYRLIKNA